MFNCIIIDDDKVFSKILESYLSQIDYLSHIKTFNDSLEALKTIGDFQADVIFLDMEMPNITGLEFLNIFKQEAKVVFVTTSKEYGPEAFERGAFDYLQKPVSFERFKRFSEKLLHNPGDYKLMRDSIFVRCDSMWVKLGLSEILYCKADNNHIIIKTIHDSIRTNLNLKDFEKQLPSDLFMRVHRSFIVRLDKISKIDGEVIQVNGKNIPVSNTYLPDLYKRLNISK